MRILKNQESTLAPTVAIFDFDGTLSTLRCGWEEIMLQTMLFYLGSDSESLCRAYINESAGVQTIHQMKWLCKQVRLRGNPQNAPLDPWFFKEKYNDRLMQGITEKRSAIKKEPSLAARYRMGGAEAFLRVLKERGVRLFAASGTDTADVREEAELLGLAGYFEKIEGAQPRSEQCSKEAALRHFLSEDGLQPQRVLICGDGKVEIRLGSEKGCRTLGVVGSEADLGQTEDPKKTARLTEAGAQALICNFKDIGGILRLLSFQEG